jgi:conjugal transfer ATP-binding protein TraC
LFSTKPEDVQALKQLRRQGLSLGDAIQQLQDSRKAKDREVHYGR